MKTVRFFSQMAAVALLATSLAGCSDFLAVENPNDPDRERALGEPNDVEALIGTSFFTWYHDTELFYPSIGLSTAADELTGSTWQFYIDTNEEPRQPLANYASDRRSRFFEGPWYGLYKALASASEGLQVIEGGMQIGEDGADTPRAVAFAYFVEGLSLGQLALLFDRAVIVDENTSLNDYEPELSPYSEVMAAALEKFDKAIEIATANTFTLPDNWINGVTMSNAELAQLAHSYKARFMASVARTPQEREAADWAAIIRHVDQGIRKDFAPVADGESWGIRGMKWYGQQRGWTRADLRTIGPADESGEYQKWLAKAPTERRAFVLQTSDRRIAGPKAKSAGTDFRWTKRGVGSGYHRSHYRYHRYSHYIDNRRVGPMPTMLVAEMDLLKAEGLLRTGGSKQLVVELINKTRVGRGQMVPATVNDPAGSWDDDQDPSPDASLWAKLKHEKRIETFISSSGLAFFDDRGWNDLVDGTFLHLPVPEKELIAFKMPVYTFGGGGEGSAASGIQ